MDLFGPFQMDFLQLMYYIREKKHTSENQKIKRHDNLIFFFTFITVFKGYFPLKPHPPVLSEVSNCVLMVKGLFVFSFMKGSLTQMQSLVLPPLRVSVFCHILPCTL